MKSILPSRARRTTSLVFLASLLAALAARAAGPFIVNTFSDTHATLPASSPNDATTHVSLRSAIEAANAQAGATTIAVPAGTYSLTLGELSVAPNGGKTITITGAGAATTIVSQTDANDRVFNIDFNSGGSTFAVISGITIQGGHDGADNDGGAGILDGSAGVTPKDTLMVSNCVVYNNHCTTTAASEIGGGVEMFGGDLTVVGCTFTNNSSGKSLGGGICFFSQTVVSALTVSNTVFGGNTVTNTSGAGPDGAGAIMITSPSGSTHNISACTFINNRVYGTSGLTYGGAIQMNASGSTLNIVNSSFLSNLVSGSGGLGGAIYVDSGTLNMSFCRLTGNSASVGGSGIYNHSSNGAFTTAVNNWWGCNGGPGAAGCDVAAADGANLNFTPWLFITNTASPTTINVGQSTTLTASVLKNSAGQTITAAQVPVLIGVPLTWSGGTHGSISAPQTSIQANGTATATFFNDNTCNNGAPSVTLDNGTSIAAVAVQCADLTVTKANNVSGAVALGNSWNWTIHVANSGPAPAPFANGNTVALDNLANANIIYGSPSVINVSGVTGTLVPAIDASSNLTITASGAVTVNAGGSFDIQLTATPAVTGTFVNPRTTGLCLVDPNNNVSESNEANNGATNSVVVTCPTITGAVSGGGLICLGNSSLVTVTVTGGTPPYSVTLSNGGGTQAGSSPLSFSVSPGATTNYQVSAGTDAHGCPITGSGSVTVTIAPVTAAITLAPASVLADSAGNLAFGPNGQSSYAWTISNGTIIGASNQPSISYVAGVSNNVVLGLTTVNGTGCSASSSAQVPIITGFSVHTNVTFTDGLPSVTMGLAFDGTNYWSCCGGLGSFKVANYGLAGNLIGTYTASLDFRSLMTRSDGVLLARAYGNGVIYQQTTPGTFVSSGITLTGGTLDPQSSVVLNGAGSEFQAMSAGVVSRWGTNGTYLGAVNLNGFGSVPSENLGPQNRGLGMFGNLWLTYNGANVVSVWSTNGNRIAQLSVPGAGTGQDSGYGFSFCNGKIFIVDAAGGKWRGFDLYTAASVAVLAAEGNTSWNADVTNKIAAMGSIPKVDLLNVYNGPTPNLAQLRSYQAVLVYSDNSFSNNVSMGNVLADYLDQGGGVAPATFTFYYSAGLGIQGRILTGNYLPFTVSNQLQAASLTLVKDVPLHPLLGGVNTFNGGGQSYHNAPISITSGSTLVAHWSDSQPLVGAKDDGAGRCAGLNFFPPSDDAFPGSGWDHTTDGARLMVNALLWSGKIPPTILAAPNGQALPIGATAVFKVAATGASTLGYQWRLNGTNLPAATGSTLSFTVQANSMGAYSVVVTNLYGATTSLDVMLVPQLRFLSPVVVNKTFSLFLADVDGSAVATNRAARVSILTTTNIALPGWVPVTNLVVPSGTQLRADGFTTTNGVNRFFRSVEAP